MTPLDTSLPPIWENLGLLIGFVFSLLILSFVIRDSWLVRAAQYLLVGVTLAYTVVLIWSNVLWPRLLLPLLTSPLAILDSSGQSGGQPSTQLWTGWLPLAAGLLLWAAGIDNLRQRSTGGGQPWLRHLAAFPLALLVGVGLGAGVAGAIQGTLLPQFWRAGEMGQPLAGGAPLLLTGLLTLLITGGALLHLYSGQSGSHDRSFHTHRFPALLRPVLNGWAWLGQRGLWLAAGVIFAHLFASRITLLIARLDSLFFSQQASDLWRWLSALVGGG